MPPTVAPSLVIDKSQFSPIVTDDTPAFSTIDQGNELFGHFLFFRAPATMESMSIYASTPWDAVLISWFFGTFCCGIQGDAERMSSLLVSNVSDRRHSKMSAIGDTFVKAHKSQETLRQGGPLSKPKGHVVGIRRDYIGSYSY